MRKNPLIIILPLILTVAHSEVFDRIEIRVNNKFLTKRMVDRYYRILNLVSGKQLTRESVRKTLINVLILEYYLDEKGISISDKDITREIERFLELNKINNLESLLAIFKKQGIELTKREFEDFIKKQIIIKKAQEHVILKELRDKITPPTESEIKDFYEKHRNYFRTPSSVRISHLVILVSDSMNIKEKIKIEDKLENISKRLRKIKDIKKRILEFRKEVEKNASEIYKKNKGDLGWFEEEKLKSIFPQYFKAIKMKVGEVSGVIVTPYTRAIFILTGKKGGEILSLAKVKERIINFILYEKGARLFKEWLKNYSKKYEIIVK